jgi:hypothetical protein
VHAQGPLHEGHLAEAERAPRENTLGAAMVRHGDAAFEADGE